MVQLSDGPVTSGKFLATARLKPRELLNNLRLTPRKIRLAPEIPTMQPMRLQPLPNR